MQDGPDTMCYSGLLKVELYTGERCTERTAMDAVVEQRNAWGYALIVEGSLTERSGMTRVRVTLPDGQKLAGGITYCQAGTVLFCTHNEFGDLQRMPDDQSGEHQQLQGQVLPPVSSARDGRATDAPRLLSQWQRRCSQDVQGLPGKFECRQDARQN